MTDIARVGALRALDEVVRQGAWPAEACTRYMTGFNDVDRNFAHKLVMGTLDEIFTIDYSIKEYTDGRRINGLVRNILRLGVYQIIYMDRVPDRAACWSSVELARDVGKGGLSGFINGVLRRITRDGLLPAPSKDVDVLRHYSVLYSQPTWLVKLWMDERDDFEELLSYKKSPSIDIRPNMFKNMNATLLKKMLDEKDIAYTTGKWTSDVFRIKDSSKILNDSGFAKGLFTIQGQMSHYIGKVAAKLNPVMIWDMCAAPGGKSASLAQECKGAKIYSTDIHRHRVGLIEKTMERLGAVNVVPDTHDGTKPYYKHRFDLVLLDAPCSGLGTLAANPDIRLNKEHNDIRQLAEIQKNLISNAANHIIEGGHLIYSTCTISKAENEDIVEYFLSNNDNYEIVPPTDLPDGYVSDANYIQTLPYKDDVDGFFIAVFRRVK